MAQSVDGYLVVDEYFRLGSVYTLPGQICSSTAKYPCTEGAIYRLTIQLGSKMGIEIYMYKKFVLLELTLVRIFDIP